MADEKKPFSRNVASLDIQAKELGIGGKLSPESDESLYKKRMQKRKEVQSKRLKVRKTKTVSYTHLTLPTILRV